MSRVASAPTRTRPRSDVVRRLEQRGQAPAHHLVVVEQEDSDLRHADRVSPGCSLDSGGRPERETRAHGRAGGPGGARQPAARRAPARAGRPRRGRARHRGPAAAPAGRRRVGGERPLPADTLRRIVELAVDLAGAEYGALGVIGEDGMLSQFVTAASTTSCAGRIGDLPTGHGILGVLIRDPRPLRIADLAGTAPPWASPANHPPMTTFLGVPVRVRDDGVRQPLPHAEARRRRVHRARPGRRGGARRRRGDRGGERAAVRGGAPARRVARRPPPR